MAESSDTPEPDPPPPRAERTYETNDDSGYDSRFDSDEADRRADAEAKRRQRTVLIIVLVATLTPFAICGLVFLGCTALLARSG